MLRCYDEILLVLYRGLEELRGCQIYVSFQFSSTFLKQSVQLGEWEDLSKVEKLRGVKWHLYPDIL